MVYKADITAATFAPEVVEAFTDGDCWELARVIGLEFGLPIVTANIADEPEYWHHAANRLPDGTILDIEGVWTEAQWLAVWGERRSDSGGEYITAEWTNDEWKAEIDDCDFDLMFHVSDSSLDYAYELVQETCPQLILKAA
jgi:hypothetical protein